MAKTTQSEEKKTRRYTKHLPEQRVFSENITQKMIPYLESQLDTIIPAIQGVVNREYPDKQTWQNIKSIVLNLCELHGQEDTVFSTFKLERINNSTYHKDSVHSSYYYVNASTHVKFFLGQIETSKKYDKEDPKQLKYYYGCLYNACCHLAYYISAPEKL